MALSDNLVSYYKFDESSGNAADSVGSNTLTNLNTTTYTTGKINNGANFVAASSQSLRATTTSLMSNYTGLSINLWFKADVSGTFQGLLWKSDDTTYSMGLRMTDGDKLAAHITTGTETTITGGTTLSTATWYMATVTYDGANIRLYLNGSSDATAVAKTGNTKTSTDSMYIGSQILNTYFDGIIDEGGIWSRALTTDEITILYNAGNGNQYPFTIIYNLVLAQGAFVLTGVATAFNRVIKILLAQGSYTYTGFQAVIGQGYQLLCSMGSYTYTGFTQPLYSIRRLVLDAGSYTYTGIDTAFQLMRRLVATTGYYVYTGFEALVYRKSWDQISKNTNTFSNINKNTSDTWVDMTKQ